MTTIAAALVDSILVLSLALMATASMRRRSASMRHAILASAILAALAMPVFEWMLPLVPVVEREAPAAFVSSQATFGAVESSAAASAAHRTVAQGGMSWLDAFTVVWALGIVVIGAGLLTGFVRLSRLRARSVPASQRWRALAETLGGECGLPRRVEVLQSTHPSLLVTCGIRRPAIILPAAAAQWPDQRMRHVLRHELAHIARHDAAVQAAAELLRMLQWINPLAWIACARLRQESEHACDDAVLRGGATGPDYAADLLEIARQLSLGKRHWTAAPAIAHPSTLERRVAAMLKRNTNRRPLGRRGWMAAAGVAIAVSAPLAAAGIGTAHEIAAPAAPRLYEAALPPAAHAGAAPIVTQTPPTPQRPVRRDPPAPQANAAIIGRVLDETGGVIPGAEVTVTNIQSGGSSVVRTNAAGEFAIRNLRAAQYEVTVRLAGFKTVQHVVTVAAGSTGESTIRLPIGAVQESIHVSCAAAAPPAAHVRSGGLWTIRGSAKRAGALRGWILRTEFIPAVHAQEKPQAPVRVGGSVRAPQKVRDVKPVCPPGVPEGATTIHLIGRIGKDGTIQDLVLSPQDSATRPPAALVDAALDAVRQWRYRPTLLNNVPLDADVSVRIVFTKQ